MSNVSLHSIYSQLIQFDEIHLKNWKLISHVIIALFRFIAMLCGIDITIGNILHIQPECEKYSKKILSVPHNNAIGLNNVMIAHCSHSSSLPSWFAYLHGTKDKRLFFVRSRKLVWWRACKLLNDVEYAFEWVMKFDPLMSWNYGCCKNKLRALSKATREGMNGMV